MTKITSFRGAYRWLSNFYEVPILYDDWLYPSVEHAYQASKTTSVVYRTSISEMTASGAKRAGQTLVLPPDWETRKLAVMEELLRQKFQCFALRTMLLRTGNAELIEGNNWGDTFWGQVDGHGHNHLGRLLMQIRRELAP